MLILCGLLGLLVVGGLFAYLMWSRAAARRVEDQLAAIRTRGEPTTPAELDAYYAYPAEGEDATALWLDAMGEFNTPAFEAAAGDLPIVGTGEADDIPPPGQPWEARGAARELLDEYDRTLGKLHEAAEFGGAARYPLEFEEGFDMLLEHAQQLRGAARLLALEARVRAAEGDAAGAARSIRTLLALARSIEREPLVISQLVGYACQGTAHATLDDLLPHVDFADEDLEMLQRELRRAEIAEGTRHALIGERVIGVDMMRHPEKLHDVDASAATFGLGTNEDLALYLETMTRFVDATDKPWPEARELAGEAEQEFGEITGGSAFRQMRYMMSSLMLPAVEAMLGAGARSDAARRLVDAAIAVERYRREHGRPPENLESLVPEYLPEVPSDPFDGEPLRFRAGDEEVVLYSIGRDETDNGGEGDLGGEPDIAVRLPVR